MEAERDKTMPQTISIGDLDFQSENGELTYNALPRHSKRMAR